MVLGKVIGTVVASRKEPTMEGLTLLLVRGCDVDGVPNGGIAIAVDAVGAGVGEIVLYCSGSSARQTQVTNNRPIDATIMAIVDEIAVDGQRRYSTTESTTEDAG
jgi:microcompartment protein CcmK/EutM